LTLSIAQGFRSTLVASGSPQNAIVLRKSATSENVSARAQAAGAAARAMPQVARGRTAPAGVARAGGHHLAAAHDRQQPANVPLRGVGPKAFEVRDNLNSSRAAASAGHARNQRRQQAVGRFKGLTLGSDVKFGNATGRSSASSPPTMRRSNRSLGRRRSDDAGFPAQRRTSRRR
jgi:hypothetical protein